MKIHWHIRAIPDLHAITPIVKFAFNNNKLTYSCEDLSFSSTAKIFIEKNNIKNAVYIENFDEIDANVIIFEWGVGLYPWMSNLIRRILNRQNTIRRRIKLLKLAKERNIRVYALPHGYNVKYGMNNTSDPSIFSFIPDKFKFNCHNRNCFNKYILENFFHLERYIYFGLSKKNSIFIPPLQYYREILEDLSSDKFLKQKKIFILPKFENKINLMLLTNAISYLAKDKSFLFIIHPRCIEQHKKYFTEYFPHLNSRLINLSTSIFEVCKSVDEVHDVGSSIGIICLSMAKKYYVHSYLSDNYSIFEEFGHPLIISDINQNNNISNISGELYSDYCNFVYKFFITKNIDFDSALRMYRSTIV